ncbi:MAG: DsbE family thiol:disulfide interchange protein [Rhodobacterales bacterium]|nr:DsbE family thiol:disulfide interchange protein [Rhodobacterales bacterium]
MARWLMVVPPVAFAALAATFWFGMQREDADSLPSTMIGRAAPEVRVTPLGAGPALTDAMLREGGAKLVNYWASWCAPCRAEHPMLQALADEGIPIYGVNYKDDPAKALGFLAELGNPFAGMGADATGRMALDWGVYGVPETYVIDGSGKVIARLAGPITRQELDRTIRPALAEAAR